MRTLPPKYLSDTPLPRESYEIDLEVLDRYQSFSAELLRVSLLGLTGYGFLITTAAGSGVAAPIHTVRYSLAIGAVLLAAAAACALGHRYFSTDAIAHHVRRLRLQRFIDEHHSSPSMQDALATAQHEAECLKDDLARCRWLLIWCVRALLLGTTCVALAFAQLLFVPRIS